MAGYFGKLPARADFVIGQCPKGFLKLWEAFLLKGLSQSRLDLGGSWKDAYMTMPIWRFDLVLQEQSDPALQEERVVAGAFMPSVDRVGREYPLTVAAEVEDGSGVEMGHWFDAAETVLLSALQEDVDFGAFQRTVADLPVPAGTAHTADRVAEGGIVLPAMPETDTVLFSRFRCRGGETDYAFICKGLPAAGAFRRLILPEESAGEQGTAGINHGRYHPEDHRT